MPAKRSKLTPAQRAKRAAKRARRAAATPQPAPTPESLPATLERLGVLAPIELEDALDASELRPDGAGDEIVTKGCCSRC